MMLSVLQSMSTVLNFEGVFTCSRSFKQHLWGL